MKLQLIKDWQNFYRLYSFWGIAILGSLGDLYNLAVQFNLLQGSAAPAALTHALNIVGFIAAASRLIKQKEAEVEAEKTPVTTPPSA